MPFEQLFGSAEYLSS